MYEALIRKYDELADRLVPMGYGWYNISFGIVLSSIGRPLELVDLRKHEEKKTFPTSMMLPLKPNGASGIESAVGWGNVEQLLGIRAVSKTGPRKKREAQFHEHCRQKHEWQLQDVSGDAACALRGFFKAAHQTKAGRLLQESEHWDDVRAFGTNAVLLGCDRKPLVQYDHVQSALVDQSNTVQKEYARGSGKKQVVPIQQCVECGEEKPVAHKHPLVHGLPGGLCKPLITSNHETLQHFNRAPREAVGVCIECSLKLAAIMEYMLQRDSGNSYNMRWKSSKAENMKLLDDDLVLVYFQNRGNDGVDMLNAVFKGADELPEMLDPEAQIYIWGMRPHSGHRVVRCFSYEAKVKELHQRLQAWQEDLGTDHVPSLGKLVRQYFQTSSFLAAVEFDPQEVQLALLNVMLYADAVPFHMEQQLTELTLMEAHPITKKIPTYRRALLAMQFRRNNNMVITTETPLEKIPWPALFGMWVQLVAYANKCATPEKDKNQVESVLNEIYNQPMMMLSDLHNKLMGYIAILDKTRVKKETENEDRQAALAQYLRNRSGELLSYIPVEEGNPLHWGPTEQVQFLIGFSWAQANSWKKYETRKQSEQEQELEEKSA
jgi:hypothetical protein